MGALNRKLGFLPAQARGSLHDKRAESLPSEGEKEPELSYDLRKLSRSQLLDLLRDAVEENNRLREELAETKRQLAERRIVLDDSESLAEAALRLSGTLDGARTAAALFDENARVPWRACGARTVRSRAARRRMPRRRAARRIDEGRA